jgi:ubiquinone/menaquinone biosynthesis C-methylase UbiE
VIGLWLDVIAEQLPGPITSILDLGCGTGRFSIPLGRRFDARVTGIDPSEAMLQQARKKSAGDVQYVQGRGEQIPLLAGSVQLVFASMVFHHLTTPETFAGECCRVLASGGAVFLRTGIRERARSYPQSEFFPGSILLMEQRLPSPEFIREVFFRGGFVAEKEGVVFQRIAANLQEFADRTATRADSVLRDVDDSEFEAGIEAIRRKALGTDGPVVEPIDYFVFQRP